METNEVIWKKAQEYGIQQHKDEFMEILKLLPEKAKGIEIGCYSGGTTIAFSMVCSKLLTIDVSKIFDTTEIEKNCKHKFIVGNSTYPEIIIEAEKYIKKQKADFLFIDGDHSKTGSMLDYKNYKHLVKTGGFIFFHDIIESDFHKLHRCYVSKTWNEVKWNREYKEFIVDKTWGGIGMLIV